MPGRLTVVHLPGTGISGSRVEPQNVVSAVAVVISGARDLIGRVGRGDDVPGGGLAVSHSPHADDAVARILPQDFVDPVAVEIADAGEIRRCRRIAKALPGRNIVLHLPD